MSYRSVNKGLGHYCTGYAWRIRYLIRGELSTDCTPWHAGLDVVSCYTKAVQGLKDAAKRAFDITHYRVPLTGHRG